MKNGGTTPDSRIAFAFRLTLGRAPTAREDQILQAAFNNSLRRFAPDQKSATEFLSIGEYPRDAKLNVGELAAYTTVASLIFNLDETITKE